MVAKRNYCFNHFIYLLCAIIIFLSKGHTSEGCLCLEKLGDKALQLPTILTHANDGSKRIFVGELAGVVNIYYPNGLISPEPFIDIRPRIHNTDGTEFGGLLGMAFHPDFSENGLFYLHFTRESDQPGQFYRATVGEFRVSSADSEKADPSYFRVILDINKEPPLHCDGGQFCLETMDISMLSSEMVGREFLLGKALRVDVDNPTENAGYSIPSDNPFLNPLPDGTIPRPEIFAYGFRNPWRCDVDTGDPNTGAGKGRIICGDVGLNRMEELDLIEKGANYGWNNFEGTSRYCFRCHKGIPGKTPTDPIHAFARTKSNRAVIGGRFYRGCSIPNIDGAFVYGNFGDGKIFRLLETGVGNWESEELASCAPHQCQGNLTTTYAPWILSFGLDEDGEIYVLSSYDPDLRNHDKGKIYRLVDPTVTAAQIESCRSKQKDLDLNLNPKTGLSVEQINSVDHNKDDATVSKVLVNTAASEIDGTASEVDTTVSGQDTTGNEIPIAGEVDATKDETYAAAGEVDTTVSGQDTTGNEIPIAGEVDATKDETYAAAGEVDTTATQEHQSDAFQEANDEPVIPTDIDTMGSNIAPIVEGIQAVLETASEITLDEFIDDLKNKVFVKLFPFGLMQTVIGPPNSPEEVETALDDSNSSVEESSDSSDDDD